LERPKQVALTSQKAAETDLTSAGREFDVTPTRWRPDKSYHGDDKHVVEPLGTSQPMFP